MDSNSSDSEENQEAGIKNLGHAKYARVLADGTVDSRLLDDEDYELVKRFLHTAFPNSGKVLKEVDQTLKRTFLLGRSSQKLNRSFSTPKPKHDVKKLSKTKLRALGLRKERKVPRHLLYEDFAEVNSLWNAYVADLFETDKDSAEIQMKLNKMDLHGAYLTVHRANCSSHEKLEGIIVKETKNTFIIVTQQNMSKVIPKSETVFDIPLEKPAGIMRVAGNSFLIRPAERVSKKIKSFMDFTGMRVYKSKLKYSSALE